MHADALLKDVPVLYMTGAKPQADLSGYADVSNSHYHPSRGWQSHGHLMGDFDQQFPGFGGESTQADQRD